MIKTKASSGFALPFNSYDSERRELQRLANSFSLAQAIRQRMHRQPLEGAEAEMHQLLATRSQINFAGNILLPSMALRAGEAGDFQTTGQGSQLVPTAVPSAALSSRQRPLLDALGVRTLASDGASIQLPRFTAGAASVKAEGVAADSSAAALAAVTLSPQRATSVTTVSAQLLLQGGADSVINGIIAELQADIARVIDATAFQLLADSTNGITTNVEEASSGGGTTPRPLTQDMLDDMLRAAFNNGADLRNVSYLASAAGFETMQGIQTNNVFALDRVTERINAKPFFASKELPDHTDGTARVIVGDFEQGLIRADFGLLDVGINAFNLDTTHDVKITLHQYFDVQILDESVLAIYREEVA